MAAGKNEAKEEDAATLLFSKEFEKAEPLLLSEVGQLLHYKTQKSSQTDEDAEGEEFKVSKLAGQYCAQLGKLKDAGAITCARTLLTSKGLHKFEVVSLVNLCPETADEAKDLIPSLEGKFSNEVLQQILDELHEIINSQP